MTRPPPPPPAQPGFPIAVPQRPSDLSVPQRQSLWAVAFLALRTLRSVGLVQLAIGVAFLFARVPSVWLFMALIALVGVGLFLGATLQWWRYTFAIVGGELKVERGVVRRQRLSIPLDRVQSVSLEQKLLHRIVSLVEISVDTAGTDEAEFVIDAVDHRVAETLQRVVAGHKVDDLGASKTNGEPESAVHPWPDRIILSHSPARILKVALTETPFAGLVLIAPIVAVGDDLAQFLPFDPPDVEGTQAGWWLLWFVPLLLLAGLVVSVVLNVVRVLLTDWNLTLQTSSAGLRRDAGLLSTTSVAATVPRVQVFQVHQTLLERLASFRTINLATIGNVKLVVPGCDADQTAAVRSLVLEDSSGVQEPGETVSQQEIFLRTRNALIFATLVAALLYFLSAAGWWSILALLFAPAVWAKTRRTVRLRRWGMTADAVADYQQFLTWKRQDVLLRKVNAVSVRQSLFERKQDLGTVKLMTAAGTISIGMLPITQARQLRDRVLFAVETDSRPWM